LRRRPSTAVLAAVLALVAALPAPAAAARPQRLDALAFRTNPHLGGIPMWRSGLRPVAPCSGTRRLAPTFVAAGRAFGLRPSIIAAVSEIESGHGCNMGPSSAGALGWTQFLPGTWREWGMDADGDGRASPYSSVDAMYSTARYLRASGAPRSYRRALFAYNRAGWYVRDVLSRAERYR
jgi:membrane-bound lytic murein transglycosylase B